MTFTALMKTCKRARARLKRQVPLPPIRDLAKSEEKFIEEIRSVIYVSPEAMNRAVTI